MKESVLQKYNNLRDGTRENTMFAILPNTYFDLVSEPIFARDGLDNQSYRPFIVVKVSVFQKNDISFLHVSGSLGPLAPLLQKG